MLATPLQGKRENATLASARFLNGTIAGDAGSRGLYSYLWQLRGGDCTVNSALGSKDGWLDLAVACNASLAQTEVSCRHLLKHQERRCKQEWSRQ